MPKKKALFLQVRASMLTHKNAQYCNERSMWSTFDSLQTHVTFLQVGWAKCAPDSSESSASNRDSKNHHVRTSSGYARLSPHCQPCANAGRFDVTLLLCSDIGTAAHSKACVMPRRSWQAAGLPLEVAKGIVAAARRAGSGC